MNIIDYYNKYDDNKYDLDLFEGYSETVENFYTNCIKKTMPDYQYVIKWHQMLMEYVDRDDAIYWIRKYEI